MKKLKLLLVLAGIMVLWGTISAQAYAQAPIRVFVDGQEIVTDVEPVIIADRTMVPLRAVGEGLGLQIAWLEAQRIVWISSDPDAAVPESVPEIQGVNYDVPPLIFIDYVQIVPDPPPTVIDGRTMVPLRAISEGLKMTVEWDNDSRTVYVARPASPPEPVEISVPEDIEPRQATDPLNVLPQEDTGKIDSFDQTTTEKDPVYLPIQSQPNYRGISIRGQSQATAAELAKVGFYIAAEKLFDSEAQITQAFLKAQDVMSYNQSELTAAEVVRLTGEVNRSKNEFQYLGPDLQLEITRFILAAYYKLALAYLEKGQIYGIRGDIAFCQGGHETGWWRFGGLVTPDQNNYCGLSATGQAAGPDEPLRGANPARVWFVEGRHGAFFDSPATGIEAQFQHLYAYALTSDLPGGTVLASPRFELVRRGIAPNWEDLAGKWAVPGYPRGEPNYYETKSDPLAAAFVNGETYGQNILKYYFRTGRNN